MRSALKGKMKGKTKAQRRSIFRAAAKGWKKKSRTKTTKSARRGRASPAMVRKYYPRSKSSGGSKSMGSKGFLNPQTIMKFIRIGALVAPAAVAAMGSGTPKERLAHGLSMYTGYDMITGTFDWRRMVAGWSAYLASILATVGIPKIAGIIRRL